MEKELEGYVETYDGLATIHIVFDGEYYCAWESGNLRDDLDCETIEDIIKEYDDKIYSSIEDYKKDNFEGIRKYFEE